MIGRGMRVFDLRYMKSSSGLGDGVLRFGEVKVMVLDGLKRMEKVGYLRCVSIGFGYRCRQWVISDVELKSVHDFRE
jgi:hypothetical protein